MSSQTNFFSRSVRQGHQFVFIEAPLNIVADLALEWGDVIWWPKSCRLSYHALDGSPLQEGKTYAIKIQRLYPLQWKACVTKYVPLRTVELTLTAGHLVGQERIDLEERSNGTRVNHEIHYRARNLPYHLLWQIFYAHHHQLGISTILTTIKEFSEKIYAERRETV